MTFRRFAGWAGVGAAIVLAGLIAVFWLSKSRRRPSVSDAGIAIVAGRENLRPGAGKTVSPRQPVSADWLVGNWSRAVTSAGREPPCDPMTTISFLGNGIYTQPNRYGRYRFSGDSLMRWKEVELDIDAGEDHSAENRPPTVAPLSRSGSYLILDGDALYRCTRGVGS